MALIYRNGRPYLYRSIRRGEQVTSEYVASGESATFFALLDAGRREEREGERQEFQAERDAAEAVEGDLADYFSRVEDLARSALYAAGYHRPKREWRRRRERRQCA